MENKEHNTNAPLRDFGSDTRPTKPSRLFNWVASVALVAVALAVSVIMFWSFDNEPVLVVNNSPFPVRTTRQHRTAGGVVYLFADYCKNRNIQGELRLSFISPDREIFQPLTPEVSPAGCHQREIPILIPAEIIPGEYVIKFRVTYKKNPLKQSEVVEFESQSVTIDPTPQE